VPYKKMEVPLGFIGVPNHAPIVNLTGHKFGKWEVLEYIGTSTWRCRCECGREKSITNWRLKNTKSCGRCSNALPDAEAAFRMIFSTYARNAKRSNREFTLSVSHSKELFGSNCCYCGKPPQAVRKARYHESGFVYNGIDRVDNSKGYIEGNCVACCFMCSRMKFKFSAVEFITHARRISAYCETLKEATNGESIPIKRSTTAEKC